MSLTSRAFERARSALHFRRMVSLWRRVSPRRQAYPARANAGYAGLDVLEPRVLMAADVQLALGTLTLPPVLIPGDKLSIPVVVSNVGDVDVAGNADLRLYLSADNAFSIDDVAIGQLLNQSLKLSGPEAPATVGQAKGFKLAGVVPSDPTVLGAGEYHFIAVLTPTASSAGLDSNVANNAAATVDDVTLAYQLGTVNGRKVPKLTLIDGNGTLVTFALSGPGAVNIDAAADRFTLDVTGTTDKSKLSVTAKKSKTAGDDGATRLGDIVIGDPDNPADTTSLGALTAPTADLFGNVQAAGFIGAVTVRDMVGGALVIGPSSNAKAATVITASHVTNWHIVSEAPLKSVTALDWQDTLPDVDANLIQAPSMGALVTKTGNFEGDLTLTGTDHALTRLGSVKIKGDINGGTWIVQGAAGAIAATNISPLLHASFDGPFAGITTSGSAGGFFAAPSFKNVSIKRNVAGLALHGGTSLGADGEFGGAGANADTFTSGLITGVKIGGSAIDLQIRVGLDPVNGVFGDGDDELDPAGTLKAFSVGGPMSADSLIIAANLPKKVSVAGVSFDPLTDDRFATEPFIDPDAPAPIVAAPDLLATSDTGATSTDNVTSDVTPTLRIIANPASLIRLYRGGVEVAQATLTETFLDFTLPTLADGVHVFTVTAEDEAHVVHAAPGSLTITVDTTSPALNVTSPTPAGTVIPGVHITGSAAAPQQVSYQMDGAAAHALPISVAGAFDEVLPTGELAGGTHVITFTAVDLAGNVATHETPFTLAGIPFHLIDDELLGGAVGVPVGVRPRIDFSEPVNPGSLTSANFFATSGSVTLPANIVVDPDGRFARLFFTNPMPAGAQITITINGSTIFAADDGVALDTNEDGVPGGTRTFSFTTASTALLPGTTLAGRLADAGPDQIPLTADDTLPGADGELGTDDDVILLPVVGAKVFPRGLENAFVLTGADGRYDFDAAPAGPVTLTLQGVSATAPAGFTFPELNAELTLAAGADNHVATIYMPRIANAAVQTVNTNQATVLTLPAAAAPGLTEEQRQLVTLEIPAHGLLGPDGLPVASAQVLFSVVPADTLVPFLPPTLPTPTLAFTTQLRGATDLAGAFRATFPNVSNAPVGTEFIVLSFDPATGKLVEDGRAVVASAGGGGASGGGSNFQALTDDGEGTSVVWDPGDEGGLAACFHVIIEALGSLGGGSGSGGGVNSVDSPDCDPSVQPTQFVFPVFIDNGTLKDKYFDTDNGSHTYHFENAAAALDPNSELCSPANQQATPLEVQITLNQPEFAPFIDGLESQAFALYPGESKDIPLLMRHILIPEDIDAAVANRLLGATVELRGVVHDPETGEEIVVFEQEQYVYRLWDIADNNHLDGTLEFERTLADGADGTVRDKPLTVLVGNAARPTITAIGDSFKYFDFAGPLAQVRFDPSSVGGLGGALTIKSPNDEEVGTILLEGRGVPQTRVVFPRAAFLNIVALIADTHNSDWENFQKIFPADANENGIVHDEPGFDAIVNNLYNEIVDGIELVNFGFDAQVLQAIDVVEIGSGIQVIPYVSLDGSNELIDGPFGGQVGALDLSPSKFTELVNNLETTSLPQEQLRLANLVNLSASDPGPRFTGIALKLANLALNKFVIGPNYQHNFATVTANILGHEIGHALGAIHTRDAQSQYLVADIMGYASKETLLTFSNRTTGIVKAGLGIPMTDEEFGVALDYYRTFLDPTGGPFSSASNDEDNPDLVAHALEIYDTPVLAGQPLPDLVTKVDFGSVSVDGAGAQSGTITVTLFSSGAEDLTLSSIALQNGNAGFSIVDTGNLPQVLPNLDRDNLQPALSQRTLTLRFDPTVTGAASDVLRIQSDHVGGLIEIPLSGQGIAAGGDIAISLTNNNLGGQKLSGPAVTAADVATIRNQGAAALTISSITIADGGGQFTLAGLPNGALTLQPGEAFSFDVAFNPSNLGLQRAHIQINSNDADTPVLLHTVVGTGLADSGSALDYGRDFVAVQPLQPDDAPPGVLRQRSDDAGHWSVYLTADTPFRHVIYDSVSDLIHQTADVTTSTGETSLTLPSFVASVAPDSDGDGLPDDIEFALGTSGGDTDSDDDGVDDFAEISAGGNPLDGVAGQTGIIGALDLTGAATDIAVAGSTAYVSTSSGLSVVDLTQPDQPALVTFKNLVAFNSSVAVDESQHRLVMATDVVNPALHIFDITDPANPLLERTVFLTDGASHVEALNGIAYVASGETLVSIDVRNGDVLQTLDLAGAAITGLAREGPSLFAVDTAGKLSAVDISGFTMSVTDTLAVAQSGDEIFVGDGIAYLSAHNHIRGGFATVDVSDIDALELISNSDVPSGARPDHGVVVDSSGTALVFGNVPNPNNPVLSIPVIDVADVSDPTDTNAYVTRFALADFPTNLTLAAGFALIADENGLLVLGYQSADTAGSAPTVSVASLTPDAVAGTAGTQVVAGSQVHLRANATDDVLVRKVDILINGAVVATDVSFPYEAFIPAGNPGALQIQARATDLAGNTALSSVLSLTVVADTFAPTILSRDPADDATKPEGLQKVRVRFSEPLDPAKVTTNNFRVVRAGQTIAATGITLQSNNRVVELTYTGLAAGAYQLIIAGGAVTDAAGNKLAAGNVTSDFTLTGGPKSWVAAGSGFWDDPANWSGGTLPGPSDNVTIDIPGDAVITFRSGDVTVNRLTSSEGFLLTGGTLDVTTTLQVNNTFTLQNGTLRNATILASTGNQEPQVTSFVTLQDVTLQTDLTISDLGTAVIQNGLTLDDVRVTLASTGSPTALNFSGDQALAGAGEIFFGGSGNGNHNSVNVDGGILTIAAGITVRGTQSGTLGSSFSNKVITLEGTVLAETNTETIILGGALVRGLLHATGGGRLELDGISAFEGSGTFYSDGGDVVLTGTLNNAGKTLLLTAETGTLFSDGGLLKGGRLETAGGAALVPDFEMILDGVTLGSNFEVPDGTTVTIQNGLTLDDANIVFLDGTIAFASPRVRFLGTQTLAGTGEVIFDGFGDTGSLSGSTGATLTIAPGISVHGARGGSVGVLGSVINQGTITADANGKEITVSGTTVTNQGTLRATNAGNILLSGTFFNTADVLAEAGSQVRLLAGTYHQTAGTSTLSGGTLRASTVSIEGGTLAGFGTVNGNLVNAATLSLGSAADPTGTLNVQGTFQQTASGILQLQLGGVATTDFDRLLATGAATLAGTLQISLASGFTPGLGNTFDVLTFPSFTGAFDTTTGLGLGGGLALNLGLEATRVRLTTVAG